MFFDKDEDDQDFLSATGGSKLASLFGMDVASTKKGNESLTYTAPKQPKKENAASGVPGSTPDLTMACIVQTYKYIDGEYKHQGKLGAAILSNHAATDYRILLYVSKQKQVTNVQISKNFVFTMQPNNYATFYDINRQGWSIMFESQQIAHKFAKEVAVAKANSCVSSLDSVIIQDLVQGDGGSLEMGDSAEVKYSGWLFTDHKLGQMFDSNVNSDKQLRFKLGKGKVIKGWETGIVGMKKGGRRLLVVPPSLAYAEQGMGDKIPPNSTLIFEIEMSRVKLAHGESTTPEQPSSEESGSQLTPATIESISRDTDGAPTEETVKSRSRSINEQLAHSPKSDKARLISRMAKMGQPMLPMVGAIPATATDSEEEDIPASCSTDGDIVPPTKPEPPLKTSSNPARNLQNRVPVENAMPTQSAAYPQGLPASQQIAVYQNPQLLPQQNSMTTQMHPHMSSVHPMAPFQTTPPQPLYNQPYPPQTYAAPVSSADVHVPVILSESRQHSTEMRMAMSTVSEKVDRILNKLETSGVSGYLNSAPSMETSILMQNIQRIVQENEHLKKELVECGTKLESQNCKIAELLQQNQKCVEQSHSLLEQRNDSYRNTSELSQSKVLTLEQEKAKLATELSSSTATVSSLQLEIAQIRKNESELRQTLMNSNHNSKSVQEQIEKMQKQHEEVQDQLKEMTNSYKEEKQQRKNLTFKMNQLSEENADLKMTNETLEKNVSDRKKKALEERRRFEEEIDEIRTQSEADIQALRKKLYSQKTSVTTTEQISQIEDDLRKMYEEKNERTLSSVQEKHNRALQSVEEEKSVLEQTVNDLQTKLQTLKTAVPENSEKEAELREQIEELKVWQEKYEKLRSQASTMKSKYDERIQELEEELEETTAKMQSLQENPSSQAATGASMDLTTEVKRIMNAVFQTSRSEFNKDETYQGSAVLSTLLQIIKTTTLTLVNKSEPKVNENSRDEEEKEDEKVEEVQEEEREVEREVEREEEETNKKDEDQTQTPEILPSDQADNIPAKSVSATRNIPQELPSPASPLSPEAASDQATADMESSDGQAQREVIDDGNCGEKKETPKEGDSVVANSPPAMESPASVNVKIVVTEAEEPRPQADFVAAPSSVGKEKGTATAEPSVHNNVPMSSSNSPSIPSKDDDDELQAKDFFSSELSAENKSDLSREDSFEDLRLHAPPPLFGSDDDDYDDQDLFG